MEEIVWCEAANALALRPILLSRQRLDKRIHDPGRLDGSDSSRHKGVTVAVAFAAWRGRVRLAPRRINHPEPGAAPQGNGRCKPSALKARFTRAFEPRFQRWFAMQSKVLGRCPRLS